MFKIGDIVTGLTVNQYPITNSRGTFEVVEIVSNLIGVKVVTHLDFSGTPETFLVDPAKFQLVKFYSLEEKILRKIAHLDSLFKNR